MTPLRVLAVGLVLVAALLYGFNPGPARFEEYYQDHALTVDDSSALSQGVTGFINERIGREGPTVEVPDFERDNRYLASIYRYDATPYRAGGEVAFLGIAGVFVPLAPAREP